ncbi:hypothetical protein A2U01_0001904 [Trifolium medium]|uniref:Uncharacterized protein n=1 Tax=Trifolium medium TaxID=97028 RepID=A0A392M282_9FABA|nr:hypothetical protein [Trifolium medium]
MNGQNEIVALVDMVMVMAMVMSSVSQGNGTCKNVSTSTFKSVFVQVRNSCPQGFQGLANCDEKMSLDLEPLEWICFLVDLGRSFLFKDFLSTLTPFFFKESSFAASEFLLTVKIGEGFTCGLLPVSPLGEVVDLSTNPIIQKKRELSELWFQRPLSDK